MPNEWGCRPIEHRLHEATRAHRSRNKFSVSLPSAYARISGEARNNSVGVAERTVRKVFELSGASAMSDTEELYLTVEELRAGSIRALKTVEEQNGTEGNFRKGVHYSEAPDYRFSLPVERCPGSTLGIVTVPAVDAGVVIPMARAAIR